MYLNCSYQWSREVAETISQVVHITEICKLAVRKATINPMHQFDIKSTNMEHKSQQLASAS